MVALFLHMMGDIVRPQDQGYEVGTLYLRDTSEYHDDDEEDDNDDDGFGDMRSLVIASLETCLVDNCVSAMQRSTRRRRPSWPR